MLSLADKRGAASKGELERKRDGCGELIVQGRGALSGCRQRMRKKVGMALSHVERVIARVSSFFAILSIPSWRVVEHGACAGEHTTNISARKGGADGYYLRSVKHCESRASARK